MRGMTRTPVIAGESGATARLREFIGDVAASREGVLLVGEEGTGKELAARSIHAASEGRDAPFRIVNGWRWFEPARRGHRLSRWGRSVGAAVAAKGGTLYVPQVGRLSPDAQGSMLKFLRRCRAEFPGGCAAPLRLIAGSEQPLEPLIARGEFDEELFEMIASHPFRIPPLRDRPEDIPAIIESLLGAPPDDRFGADAIDALVAYHWPGNCDELVEEVERLIRTGHFRIRAHHLRRDITCFTPSCWPCCEPLVLEVCDEIDRLIQEYLIETEQYAVPGDAPWGVGGPHWDLEERGYRGG